MKINKETIARTIVLLIALVNQILTMFGINPIPYSNDEVYIGITSLLTVGASLWTWWKNNSFTSKAIEADNYLKELKAGDKDDKEL